MNVLTIDIDWAPDWMISEIAERLLKAKIKVTWFATHMSKVVEELINEELFEVGIHPNCLPGSTQGKTEDEVMNYMKNLFPKANVMRTHSLYYHTKFIYNAAKKYGIKIDVSLFVPTYNYIKPYKIFFADGTYIWQVPFSWEDDIYLCNPEKKWDIIRSHSQRGGSQIYNFHCVHIYLNSENLLRYQRMKKIRPNVQTWTKDFVNKFRNSLTSGINEIFSDLISELFHKGEKISELIPS